MVNHNKMGLVGAISYIIGNIIGSGIFITPTSILENTKSIGLSLTIWVVAAIISMVGAFIYVELGTSIRKSGADFAYICYVKWYPIAVAFMFVGCTLTYPATTAIQSETFVEYVIKGLKIEFANTTNYYVAKKLAAFSLIWLLMFLNFFSVKTFVQRFQIFASLAKLVSAAIVICIGFYFLIFKAETEHFDGLFQNSTWRPGNLVNALFAGLYSYDGWDILNFGAEEVDNPRRTMPLAIVFGMSMVAIIYLAINVSYFTVLTIADISNSDAVAVTLAQKKLGNFQYIMPFVISILLVGSLNSTLFAASRYLHAAARHGNLPSFISCTNKFHDSPRAALFVHIILAIVFSFAGDLNQLITYVAFAQWSQRAFTMLALLYIRFGNKPVHKDAIRTPIILPILFFTTCVVLVGVTIGQNLSDSIIGLGIIIAGFLTFFIFMWDRSLPSYDFYQKNARMINEKVAIVFQILFNGMIDQDNGDNVEPKDTNRDLSAKLNGEKSNGGYDNKAMDESSVL